MAIEKVRKYFEDIGIADRIQEFDVSSATVELAAQAVGVEGRAREYARRFRLKRLRAAVLIEAAGDGKINNQKFKQTFGFKAKMLTPEEVIEFTGHAIGGVCAFAIEHPDVKAYTDVSLKRFTTVFPACGSANSAIELTPDELHDYSNAVDWIDVCKLPEDEKRSRRQ